MVYRCFPLCSDWTNFHREILTLKEVFQRSGYLTAFIDKYFKKILDRLHIKKTYFSNKEKEAFMLSITVFGADFFKVRTKMRNAMKGTLYYFKLSLKAKERSLICLDLKIVYLTI